jgi:hypothetical protein
MGAESPGSRKIRLFMYVLAQISRTMVQDAFDKFESAALKPGLPRQIGPAAEAVRLYEREFLTA